MDDVSPPRVRTRSARRVMFHICCIVFLVAGVVLQATVRDRIRFPVAGLYYALPRPVVLFLAILAALTAAPGKQRRRLHAVVIALLSGWIAWCDVGWHAADAPPSPNLQSVIFWNVGRNLIDDVHVVDQFLDTEPAVIGLVETGELSDEWLTVWQARREGYDFFASHPGCLLIVRGDILQSGYEQLGYNSHAVWMDAKWQDTVVRAVVVDISANPWMSRRQPLQRLNELLTEWGDRPLIVMGDFNTPTDSVWFGDLRQNFREVFETNGAGYVPTWPWPLPVLTLDQIWVNKAWGIFRSERLTTWRSDHRPVSAELELIEGDR